MPGETLSVSIAETVAAQSVGPGGQPPAGKAEGGAPPQTPDAPQQSMTAILFDGIALFARGPARAFSTCLLAR